MTKKPKNLKQRDADSIMKPLAKRQLDPFQVVEERGFTTVADLTGTSHATFDWRTQWSNDKARMGQIVEITIDGRKGTFSRQEIEKALRHV